MAKEPISLDSIVQAYRAAKKRSKVYNRPKVTMWNDRRVPDSKRKR